MAKRRYGQYCALARGLDMVGERWTLLVVRELLLGPKRYTDLLDALPGIGTNLLADRLKELEQHEVVRRTKLPSPAPAAVYELTEYGRGLEPTIVALARWGSRELRNPRRGEHFRPAWLGLAMLAAFRPEAAAGVNETYEFRIGTDVLHARVEDGALKVFHGPAQDPDLTFECTERTLRKILSGRLTLTGAVADGEAQIEGERSTLARCGDVFGLSERSREPAETTS